MIRALSGLLVVGLGLAAFVLQVGQPWTVAAAGRALQGLLGAGLWACAGLGVGALLLGGRERREVDAVQAFALGLGVLGLVLLLVAAVPGLLGTFGLGLVAVLGVACRLRGPKLSWPEVPAVVWMLLAVWALPGLLDALAPPVDTDEVYLHLALPKILLTDGGLAGGFFQPDGSRPLPVHLLWTGALALGGEAAPKLLHLVWALVLGLAVVRTAERRYGGAAGVLALALLLGSYSFVRELGLAYNNLPAALWVLLALDAALEVRAEPSQAGLAAPRWRLACFAGMALAAKYTAAPAVVAVYVVAWARLGWRRVPQVALLSGLALAWVVPWWVRNGLEGLHPLFPYAGWPDDVPIHFMLADKYGVGREVLDLLLLPWNATVEARTDSFAFLGRVTPAALALGPLALVFGVLRRDGVVAAAGIAFVGWGLGPHWLRYLLPASPLLAVAAVSCLGDLGRWGRVGVWGIWGLGLPANLGPWLVDVVDRAPAAVGAEAREDLLARRIHGWEAVAWINSHTDPEERTALLFAWPTYYVERPTLLGSVEDHIPSRFLVLRHGAETLGVLREAGVRYVLANRVRFLDKSYPFLSPEEVEAQFRAPVAALERGLLAEGVLVFEQGRFGVWRLHGP